MHGHTTAARSAVMSGLCFLLLALGASGCSGPTEVCALPGCQSGLYIELVGDLPAEFTVTAEVPGGGGPPVTVECTPEFCNGQVWLPNFTPDQVRITIETDGATTTELFEPSYEVRRPGSSACPSPECLLGWVVMQLPEDFS